MKRKRKAYGVTVCIDRHLATSPTQPDRRSCPVGPPAARPISSTVLHHSHSHVHSLTPLPATNPPTAQAFLKTFSNCSFPSAPCMMQAVYACAMRDAMHCVTQRRHPEHNVYIIPVSTRRALDLLHYYYNYNNHKRKKKKIFFNRIV